MNSNWAILGVIVIVFLLGAYGLGWFSPPREPKQVVETGEAEEQTYAGSTGEGEPMRPRDACVVLCEQRLSEGMDLSDGPCLSNSIAEDWVCDVAHSPRKQVDNDPENQCSEYGKGAKHFVEVSPKCKYLREV
jgi:hypothetical protein